MQLVSAPPFSTLLSRIVHESQSNPQNTSDSVVFTISSTTIGVNLNLSHNVLNNLYLHVQSHKPHGSHENSNALIFFFLHETTH